MFASSSGDGGNHDRQWSLALFLLHYGFRIASFGKYMSIVLLGCWVLARFLSGGIIRVIESNNVNYEVHLSYILGSKSGIT